MKNFFLMGCIAMSLLITSCEKSNQDQDSFAFDTTNSQLVSTNDAESMDALTSLEDLSDELLESRDANANCPTITSTAPKGTFPNVFTIDYGTGCTDKKGRFHSGKIIIAQNDSMKHPGAKRVITFQNFGMDSVKLKNGKIETTIDSRDENGNLRMVRRSTDLNITGPNGTLEINFVHARIQMRGGATPSRLDDVWKIEGQSTGTVNGVLKFESKIREALTVTGDCAFIVSGTKSIMHNDKNIEIHFGNGFCDRFAKVTLPNGDEKIITLKGRR